jgi:hypothetical protein
MENLNILLVDKYTSLNLSIVKLVVGVPVISPTVALRAAPTLVLAVKATVDAVYGKLELPEDVIIEQNHILEVCGTLMRKTNNVFVRDSGSFKAGNPAQTSSSYVDVTTTSQLTWSPVRMSLPPASITMLLKEYDLAANLHSVSRYISKSVALLHVAFKRGLISVVSSA